MRLAGIALCLVLAASVGADPARAEADLGFKGAGGKLSYVDADVGHTLGFGAFLDLGEVTPDWALQFNLSYWSTTDKGEDGAPDVTTDLLTVEADLRYMFDSESPRFRPYAGGGLGLHFGGTVSGDEGETGDAVVGVTFVAGTTYEVDRNLDLVGEFRYVFAGKYDHWSLSAGVGFRFDP